MTVEELLVYAKQYIHSEHAKILLASLLEKNSLELLNCLEDVVDEEIESTYKQAVQALKEGKPLQYVLGKTSFYGREFIVNENVLIPRFETEQLVEETIKLIIENFNLPINILDIGTGSGNIGITLKKELDNINVTMIDISKEALTVAEQNKNNLQADVTLIESDLFKNINSKYDVIISNPPYIKNEEEIEQIVKDNEPHLALYANNDGLYFYEEILKQVENYTNNKYLIAFEIGYLQKEDILGLIDKYLSNVEVITKKDLAGKDRMIFILKNE